MMSNAGTVYRIADVLLADLKYKDGRFYGSGSRSCGPLPINWRIVASITDDVIAACVVRLRGSLYIMLLYDARTDHLTLLVLDGGVLGLNEQMRRRSKVDLFERRWSRRATYAAVAPGVRAVYGRWWRDDCWTLFQDGAKMLRDYVERRDRGMRSDEAMTDPALGI